jgi:DNA recombination protein RmuC
MFAEALAVSIPVWTALLSGVVIAAVVGAIVSARAKKRDRALRDELAIFFMETKGEFSSLSQLQTRLGESWSGRLSELTEVLSQHQNLLQKSVSEQLSRVEKRFGEFTVSSQGSLDSLRSSVDGRLEAIRKDNADKLEQMRLTVDEKLQKTLDERLANSFSQVSRQLEQVHKGLGEMQTLALGVGDLKKVLSNVKTRGVLGEIQLGAILDQILSPEQYSANVAVRPDSRNLVEYAVRLPGDGERCVWLPIDAKFPADAYSSLVDAYDTGSQQQVDAAKRQLETRILQSAKDIKEKYVEPPFTTDFAILFLPFEGLYAEVVRLGLVERLNEMHINIAGPTTMAALLNALCMGFRTLAIQKRTDEIWQVLGAVKTEFANFGVVLKRARERLNKTGEEIELLVGRRTRAIERRLKDVTELSPQDSVRILSIDDAWQLEDEREVEDADEL